MITKTCPICGTVFQCSTNRIYCNDKCAKKAKRKYSKIYQSEKREIKKPVAERKSKKTNKFLSIEEIVKKATAMGLTYGEYMVKYGG